jgi:PAS domain-containing protein
VRRPVSSSISPSVRDALAVIHQQTLELIVQGASLDTVLDALCDGIDTLDPDLISSVLLADPDGQRLWPQAGRRVPEAWRQFITPLPIGPCMGACGTAAFRKDRVINQDIATDPLWSGPAEKYRAVALQYGFRSTWSVPLLSKDGDVLGTFGLYHTHANAVGADEIEVVEQAGNIALLAIERDRAQAALASALAAVKKSESELRTMVDMIPQMIAVLAPDGQALYVNELTLECREDDDRTNHRHHRVRPEVLRAFAEAVPSKPWDGQALREQRGDGGSDSEAELESARCLLDLGCPSARSRLRADVGLR